MYISYKNQLLIPWSSDVTETMIVAAQVKKTAAKYLNLAKYLQDFQMFGYRKNLSKRYKFRSYTTKTQLFSVTKINPLLFVRILKYNVFLSIAWNHYMFNLGTI